MKQIDKDTLIWSITMGLGFLALGLIMAFVLGWFNFFDLVEFLTGITIIIGTGFILIPILWWLNHI